MATSNTDIKAIMAARRAGTLEPRPVPQLDPVEALTPPEPPPPPAAEVPAPAAPSTPPVAADAGPVRPKPAVLRPALKPAPAGDASGFNPMTMLEPIDRTEELRVASFNLYPSRRKQLKQLAYLEGRNQWQIIEDAMTDYVKKHYGIKQ